MPSGNHHVSLAFGTQLLNQDVSFWAVLEVLVIIDSETRYLSYPDYGANASSQAWIALCFLTVMFLLVCTDCSHAMYFWVLCPLPECLPIIPKDDSSQTEEENQRHVGHNRRNVPALDNPRSDEFRESISPDVLVDSDGHKYGTCNGFIRVDWVGRGDRGKRGNLNASTSVADYHDDLWVSAYSAYAFSPDIPSNPRIFDTPLQQSHSQSPSESHKGPLTTVSSQVLWYPYSSSSTMPQLNH